MMKSCKVLNAFFWLQSLEHSGLAVMELMCAYEHVACLHSPSFIFSIVLKKESEVQESRGWILLLYRALHTYTLTFETVVRKPKDHRRRSERGRFCFVQERVRPTQAAD